MNHFWQNITSFTQRERRGAIVFVLILICITGINQAIPHVFKKEPWYIVKDTAWVNQWKQSVLKQARLDLKKFNPNKISENELLQMGIPASLARSWVKYTSAGGYFATKPDLLKLYGLHDTLYAQIEPYITIPKRAKHKPYYHQKYKPKNEKQKPLKKFDPNTNTRNQLLQSGLKPKVVKTIISYRKAGGRFENKEDLQKLYTIDSVEYKRISDFVDLPKKSTELVKIDSIEINSATKTDFIQINIKSFMAGRIIKYRELLGGFYTFAQLKEVYNIDSTTILALKKSSWIDTLLIKHISINSATEQEFAKHPYINRRQAGQIYKYQKFVGRISEKDEIRELKIMNSDTYKKLKPYLEI